ncbi:thiamine pyrophosphate-dependent dehydrogenase E1 component subunit alpha [Alphaproteobacteria bacterium]|nr:thiamine pyrophosphate-dependent dehydrogenase E1 component subunit alpha [Alphaproteobacteria bacterium]
MKNLQEKIDLFKKMLFIRAVEEKIAREYHPKGQEQQMRCPIHLSIGQEASAVGVCNNLNIDDQIFSTHRCHAHYLAKDGDLRKMIFEIFGKIGGCIDGRGGSMHLMDSSKGIELSIPIVASSIPISVGAALTNKLDKNNKVSVSFFGDACLEEGVSHESFNFASVSKLPVLFVCENNLYSVYTHLNDRQPNRSFEMIGKAHDIKTTKLNGNDVFLVNDKIKEILSDIRSNLKPHLLILDTYRYREHCGPNFDDHLNYRDAEEVEFWKQNDPVILAEKKIIEENLLTIDEIKQYRDEVEKELMQVFQEAFEMKLPDKSDASKFVYA